MREANLAHGAGRIGPPGVDGPVGEPQVAEEVEGHRWRPQEVGPQSLVIEALVRFGDGRSGPGRPERAGGEEGGAGFAGVGEREPTPDRTGSRPFTRDDRLRSNRMALRLAPPRLVVAQTSTEVRHLRSPWDAVVGFPAMRGLELLPRGSLGHVSGFAGSRARAGSAMRLRPRRRTAGWSPRNSAANPGRGTVRRVRPSRPVRGRRRGRPRWRRAGRRPSRGSAPAR